MINGNTAFAQVSDIEYSPSLEEEMPSSNKDFKPLRPVLTGRIAEEQFLPDELYGTWQVNGTLVSTNAPNTFKQKTADIWLLQQVENKIRLANPNNYSETYITVNEVDNNRATFTCSTKPNRKYDQMEQVTIEVNGDNFAGYSNMRLKYFKAGKLIRIEQALFKLHGQKLSGSKPPVFELNR
jgi:hypothetical protein